jgi:hypothetical protein
MQRIVALIASAFLVVLIGGCEPAAEPCDEFNPPPGHKPSSCPPKPVAEHAVQPPRYCYRSLAQADCYSEPQPDRPGFLGSTEVPKPPAPPAKDMSPAGDSAPAKATAPAPAN